jgi:hypothetical protein
MMMAGFEHVNATACCRAQTWRQKKAGLKEPGLRYWPREADTITFQEGLLSFRATGGGGQMRDANAQRRNTMIRVSGLQQAPTPHVSHAEIGVRNPFDARANDCIAANEASDSKERESKIHPDWAEKFYRMVD